MMRMIRGMTLAAVALGLTACGGGAKLGGGKNGAAQAAFQASQPAGRGSKTGQALVDQALASGAASISLSASCSKGGRVSLVLDAGSTPKVGFLTYVVRYEDCNEDGQNEYSGQMATTMGFDLDNTPNGSFGSFVIAMKGKLTIEGAVSDFIDTDVRLSMDFAATSLRTGSVKLVLDGTITTSTQKYVYAHETLATAAGELPRG